MSDDADHPAVTLAEAVPLATVVVQRLLWEEGVRSLAIKGPSFVELGVRQTRTSNDVDLLIHPDDRVRTHEILTSSEWRALRSEVHPSVAAVVHARSYQHPLLPSTVDVHHRFPGLLADDREVFAVLWASRTSITLAHHLVTTTSAPHALVIETVNALRSTSEEWWPAVAERVRDGAVEIDVGELTGAAESIGAARTAGPLIVALGGRVEQSGTDPDFQRWRLQCGTDKRAQVFWAVVRRDSLRSPATLLWHVLLPERRARLWADAHGVPYRSPAQIAVLRVRKVVGAVASGTLASVRRRGAPWS